MIIEIIDGIKYRLNEDKLTAEVRQMMGYKGDIIIPETIVFNEATYRVTSIGYEAFKGCSSLTSITIPDGVTSIGMRAFRCCDSLESITIPASVTSIGYSPFYKCSSLASIVVAEGNTVYDSRENCNALIHTATNTLLYGCQNTIIPDGVTSIGDFAFCYCSFTSIVIPNSVTSIGMRAFRCCDSLESITIPASVTSIGHQAFYGCDSLTKVIIPASVTSIEEEAFYYCDELRTIRYGGTIAQWKEIAHFCAVLGCPTRVVRCTDGDVKL